MVSTTQTVNSWERDPGKLPLLQPVVDVTIPACTTNAINQTNGPFYLAINQYINQLINYLYEAKKILFVVYVSSEIQTLITGCQIIKV
jgi:hypothetical protein